MPKIQTKTYFEKQLPARLTKELYKVARKYETKGVKLFVFGSFARSNERKTSDLDIGVLWTGKRNPGVFTALCRDIEQLPTIRKIDLVDMEQVEKDFRTQALSEAVMLLDKNVEYEPS